MAEWTHEEEKIVVEMYEKAPRADILQNLPGRDWKSIYKKAIRLNLYRPKDNAWKTEEDELLKKVYSNTPIKKIIPQFPGRTWKGIKWRAINIFRLKRDFGMADIETKATNIRRRGVEYPTQNEEIRKKVRATVQDKYGVDNVFQAKNIKEKIAKTNLKKYGVKNPNQNKTIRKKTIQTNKEKHGVENTFQLVDRVKQGMINKYGVTTPLKVPCIRKKAKETSLKKYGYDHPSKSDEVRKKLIKIANDEKVKEKKFNTMKKNRKIGSSKEELNFLMYLKLADPDVKTHILHPLLKHNIDFYMPKFDLWVQYDGTYWHGKTISKGSGKQNKGIKRVIENDILQKQKIPNLIRFWSDEVKEAIKNDTIFILIENKIKEKMVNANSIFSCHQYQKKIEHYHEDIKQLPFNSEYLKASNFELCFEKVSTEIIEFIKKYEWLGTIGTSPKWCFTARYKELLGGVVLINEPNAYSQILGKDTKKYEALIQRGATASWTPKNLGSRLIMFSCRWMVNNTEKRAFTCYADPSAKERGIIYQACNFDYLGNKFGNSYMYKHPEIDRIFSSQHIKRTSTFRKWCSENNIQIEKTWFKLNGFKDIDNIPDKVKKDWYAWIKRILSEAEKVAITKKSKYVLVLPKNKKEKKHLNCLKTYIKMPYIKNFEMNSEICSPAYKPVINHGITTDRKNSLKIDFIIKNHKDMSRPEIARELNETQRWVKRQIAILTKEGKVIPKR